MSKKIRHRGPDWSGIYSDEYCVLAHERLSIVDVDSGAQPLYDTKTKRVLAVNGEIYNHLELRKHIKHHTFKTLCDTETLLALFIEYGSNSLEMCDGMFAFIIYDIENNKLILARDRIGKKPIYLYKNQKQIFIASELNTFKDLIPNLSINEIDNNSNAIVQTGRIGKYQFIHKYITL